MTNTSAPIVGTMTHAYATAEGVTVTARERKSFERELCRRLVTNGLSGPLELCDAHSGRLRLMFADIAAASMKDATETAARGPHLVRHTEVDWTAVRAA